MRRGLRTVAYICFVCALVLVYQGTGIAQKAPNGTSTVAATTVSTHTATPVLATTTPGYLPIERVIDGDTFIVLKDGHDVTVRLIGMDTPEVVDPRKPVECYGPQASAEAKKLLTGGEIKLVQDPTQDQYDKYGRYLAYAYMEDGTLYNEFMIEQGFAHEYTYNKAYEFQKEFKQAQADAKAAQRGFWSPSTCDGNTGVGSKPTPVQ